VTRADTRKTERKTETGQIMGRLSSAHMAVEDMWKTLRKTVSFRRKTSHPPYEVTVFGLGDFVSAKTPWLRVRRCDSHDGSAMTDRDHPLDAVVIGAARINSEVAR
jgi:hypothetical protein